MSVFHVFTTLYQYDLYVNIYRTMSSNYNTIWSPLTLDDDYTKSHYIYIIIVSIKYGAVTIICVFAAPLSDIY